MKNRTIILTALAVLFLGFLLTGCTTQKKAIGYFNSHGFQAATYCEAAFPVRDSTVYLPGETKVISHTDTVPGEVIPCPPQQPGQAPASVTCPPSTHTTDTITRTDTTVIYRENTAKTAALTQDVTLQTARADKAENGRGKWRKWCLITWVAMAVGFGSFLVAKFKII